MFLYLKFKLVNYMKNKNRTYFLCLYALNIFFVSNAQVSKNLEFFPFHKGNQWQFRSERTGLIDFIEIVDSSTVNTDSSEIYIYKRRISFYQNMPSVEKTEKYFIDFYSDIYDVNQSSNTPQFKLIGNVGNSWLWGNGKIEMNQIFTKLIFNKNVSVKSFAYGDTSNTVWYATTHLAEGFGPVEYSAELGYTSILAGCIINQQQYGVITGVEKSLTLPSTPHLFQNYPNPFNPSTIISYQIPEEKFVSLKVFDLIGRELRTLVNETQKAGFYSVSFDASQLSSGIYFYSLPLGTFTQTKRMIILK